MSIDYDFNEFNLPRITNNFLRNEPLASNSLIYESLEFETSEIFENIREVSVSFIMIQWLSVALICRKLLTIFRERIL